ncbi:hypothetical protein JTE90_020482 [Oedothorax gibbosus]|uniref:CUT domain-containing protein n=1 Tax=Oedothorax gibbosus TaxID=931172 RepID=A0AAV6USQ7_9ARAC|nr:hypothetical protein JTE90_020482 [Oedothorax gibbosus]
MRRGACTLQFPPPYPADPPLIRPVSGGRMTEGVSNTQVPRGQIRCLGGRAEPKTKVGSGSTLAREVDHGTTYLDRTFLERFSASDCMNMLDASDFRALAEPTYQTLNGRMSPPGFATAVQANSYATLTPLQPLPPISTMSDKFTHHYGHHHAGNVGGGFALMQNNLGMAGHMANSYHQYEKLNSMAGMNMNPHPSMTMMTNGLQQQGPPYSQNGLHSPEKNMSPNGYESYAHRDLSRGLVSPQSPTVSPSSMMSTLNGLSGPHMGHQNHHLQSNRDVKPPTATTLTSPTPISAVGTPSTPATPGGIPLTQPSAPIQASVPNSMNGSMVSMNSNQHTKHPLQQQQHHSQQKVGSAEEVEEINTKELAQRISAELKRYSIPQAIFAQRVLCRSQGTLSDLLRNPKPWSKLKSGRETFRRMYKWLEEPEFQRMSALRLAGKNTITSIN